MEEKDENILIQFCKWLKHLDNGTEHYDPETKTKSESIGFSPYECFNDNSMPPEELVKRFLEIKGVEVKKEEKMYPLSVVEKAFDAGIDFANCTEFGKHYPDKEEWIKELK